jgi:hypothetical protein
MQTTLETSVVFSCVPVILSDEYVLPYSSFIPWSTISIRWPEALVEEDGGPEALYDYLAAIPVEYVEQFQDNLKKVNSISSKFRYFETRFIKTTPNM